MTLCGLGGGHKLNFHCRKQLQQKLHLFTAMVSWAASYWCVGFPFANTRAELTVVL